jgi:hypothetical protein
MNSLSTPMPGENLAEAGERIRAACPISGATATDHECRDRHELITDALRVRGIQGGDRSWHTAQLADGHVVGVWADSVEEAELNLTVWWGERCHWVIPDPGCRVLQEYFPRGKRSAAEADARFRLGTPRKPRDRFAPADSLLDPLPTAGGELDGVGSGW